jgi:hypothetical protein
VTSSASRLVLLNWPPPGHLWIGTKSRHVLLPQRVTNARASIPAETAAQTRIVSVDRIRLDPWKSVRPFKGIFCHDISEFESYMPSQPVWSPPPFAGGPPKSPRIGPIPRIGLSLGVSDSATNAALAPSVSEGLFLASRF